MGNFVYAIIDFDKRTVIRMGSGTRGNDISDEQLTEWIKNNIPLANVYSHAWSNIIEDDD